MIRVTIAYRGKQKVIVCSKVVAMTNRQVTCYFYRLYELEKIEYHNGRIIAVEAA